MSTIYFWSHGKNKYTVEQWRHIFSQWYKHSFKGDKDTYIYDLTGIHPDYNNLIHDITFNCREQWMMIHKAILFNDMEMYSKIMKCKRSYYIKKLGRRVKNFEQSEWDKWKYQSVVNGNYLQFSQDENLKEILLNTDSRELVEASPLDKIWGIGFGEKSAEQNREKWGSNLLGKALMEVRATLLNN